MTRESTPLGDYLDAHGLTQEVFASRIGVSQPSLSKIMRRLIKPSIDTAARIERETKGAIPAATWAGLPPNPEETQHAA